MREQAYSVSQVNRYIKSLFVQDEALRGVTIRGEVWGCKYHSSGHLYFTLKDEGAAIACVMFSGQRDGLRFRMENGQSVLATGSVGVYERDGKYQLYANEIQLDGAGALYERFERLKRDLREEGLFDEENKKRIPRYVRTIGVVTAETGAVIQDICNVAARRNPYVQIVLYPAKVQGEGAAHSIVQGIRTLDGYQPDVIIVGRGGGSIEDLFAFNEEVVARAIYQCNTPLISAVGHETDTTIADFVADLRAPTPSAAAELAVFSLMDFQAELGGCANRLNRLMEGKLGEVRLRLTQYKGRLQQASPMQAIYQKRQYLAELWSRGEKRMEKALLADKHRLAICAEKLNGLSPLNKLKGGYAYVRNEEGEAVRSVKQMRPGSEMEVVLGDGSLKAKVEEVVKRKGMWAYGEEGGE